MAKTELRSYWRTLNGIPMIQRHDLGVFETVPRNGSRGAIRIIDIHGRSPVSGRLIATENVECGVLADPDRPGAPAQAGQENEFFGALLMAWRAR